ncbi:MAG: response regulator [Candidatus Thermoplasmatota archaeon]|jgi:DNA-binding NtrC family response regulator|nr:response regulator [Candidatus Thermoplasmatota archaeon]
MIVDDETSVLEYIKTCLKKEDIEVVTVDNNRKAFEILDDKKENDFNLILIKTKIPNTNTIALFPIKPNSTKNIDIVNEENFLKKPFTEEGLLDFIKKKL